MIILYPTDTVYGLGAVADDPAAIATLKELKGRDGGKPISIAVSDVEMLRKYAEVTPLAERLIKKFLPGKLTIVLNAKDVLEGLTAGTGTIGIRIPNNEKALALIKETGKPLTATSANVSGMPTEQTPEKILAQFGDKASLITQVIDAGELPKSEPSTVVDARGETPIIIREAAISKEKILHSLATQ